jgi:prepilin-type N-terminal cleavage/methylation domain-containing protein
MVSYTNGTGMIDINTEPKKQNGFSLIELIVTFSVLAILTAIGLVNLSSSRINSRLLSTTRDLENWLNDQRSYTKTHNLTCFVSIDSTNKRLNSTRYPGEGTKPCIDSSSVSMVDVFDVSENFGGDSEKLTLHIRPPIAASFASGGILFSLQGFSQNFHLDSEDPSKKVTDGELELRLKHTNLKTERCIRIISPIGMIRDGRKDDPQSDCRYDTTN